MSYLPERTYRPRPPLRPAGRGIYGRRRRPRYGLIGLIVTVLLLLIFGLFRACTGGDAGSVSITGYVDSVRPYIQRSNDIGVAFKAIPTDLESFTREDLSGRLDKLIADAQALSAEAARALPSVPGVVLPAHGYLLTALRARAEGLDTIKTPILSANLGEDPGLAMAAFRNNLHGLILGDTAYGYFEAEIKARLDQAGQESEVPASSYILGTDLARPEVQDDFVNRLRASEKLKATVEIFIAPGGFQTVPNAFGGPDADNVYGLPASGNFELLVDVTNRGTSPANNVVVSAQLQSSLGKVQQDSDAIEVVPPGETRRVALRNLDPDRGDAINRIDISANHASDGDRTDNERSFRFRIADE